MWKKTLATALTASVGVIALSVSEGTVAFASGSHDFVGYRHLLPSGKTVYLAEVNMTRTDDASWVSNSPQDVDSAWVMMDNNGSSWAQTGFLQYNGYSGRPTGIYYYFEENDPTYGDTQILTNGYIYPNTSGAVGPAAGYSHSYQVVGNTSGSYYDGTVDGAFSNAFYAYAGSPWSAIRVEYMEEILDDSQGYLFGSTGSPTLFKNALWQTYQDGATSFYPSATDSWKQGSIAEDGLENATNMGTSSNQWGAYDTLR